MCEENCSTCNAAELTGRGLANTISVEPRELLCMLCRTVNNCRSSHFEERN